jgi:hypothetical protein
VTRRTATPQAPKPSRRQSRPPARRLDVELLEQRCLLTVGPGVFRSVTEFGNNQGVGHQTWGMSGVDLLRVEPTVHYTDGISAPSAPNGLSPRFISNQLNNQSSMIFQFLDDLGVNNTAGLSDYSYVWGQFIDHDMDLTLDNSGQPFNIQADTTLYNGQPDPMGQGTNQPEQFGRSKFDQATGTSTANPRQQVNSVTSYLDLSQVYGSTQVVADALRVVEGFTSTGAPILGAHLKTSPGNLLPFNNTTYFTPTQITALNMANDAMQVGNDQLFAAGDRRANENIELTAIQTLFMRNHNRLVDQLQTMNPADFGLTAWTDNNLYQEARKLNIAEEQIINYGPNGYLASLFGANVLPAYAGYQSGVNATISTEFSTVGFRYGHSLLSNAVGRNNNDGTDIADVSQNGAAVNLLEAFFRPDLITPTPVTVNLTPHNGLPGSDPHTSSGIGAILKADADNAANENDLMLIDEVRSGLFSLFAAPGTDLAARDIQRARDHGIGSYNDVRTAYGLPAVTTFAQISSNHDVQTALANTYGTVDKIDPFEGMLAEDHINGTDFGRTITAIIAKQFKALRDGDRFFYLNEAFTPAEQTLIAQGDDLADVIENNTAINNLQGNVFFFTESITGTVKVNGVPFQGITIDLKNAAGTIIAQMTTDANGNYEFTQFTGGGIPNTGNYTVEIEVPPPSGGHTFTPITPISIAVHMSRGNMDFDNIDFGLTES